MELKKIFNFLNKDEDIACPKCKNTNKHSVFFNNSMICPECGASQLFTCPKCKKEINENSKFCPECGTKKGE